MKNYKNYICFSFYIRFGSPILKEKNLLMNFLLGWAPEFFYYLGRKKRKKSLNLNCEGQPSYFFSLHLETWWSPYRSTLNYKGWFGSHQITFCSFFFRDLLATRSFNIRLWRTTLWPPYFQVKRKKKTQSSDHQIIPCNLTSNDLVATKSLSGKKKQKQI
jgi:hypothetical protein